MTHKAVKVGYSSLVVKNDLFQLFLINQQFLIKHTTIIDIFLCTQNKWRRFVCLHVLSEVDIELSRLPHHRDNNARTCVCLIAHCCQNKSPMMRHWQGDTIKGRWEKHETERITSNHGLDTGRCCSNRVQLIIKDSKSIPRFSTHQPSSNPPSPFSTTASHYLFALGQAYKLIGVTESS